MAQVPMSVGPPLTKGLASIFSACTAAGVRSQRDKRCNEDRSAVHTDSCDKDRFAKNKKRYASLLFRKGTEPEMMRVCDGYGKSICGIRGEFSTAW